MTECTIIIQREVFNCRSDWHVPIAFAAELNAFHEVRKTVLYLPSLCRAAVAKDVQMPHGLNAADLRSSRSSDHSTRRTYWCSSRGDGWSWKQFLSRDPHFSSRFVHLSSLLTVFLDNSDHAGPTFVGFPGDENSRA